jgi:hypothetical protein
MPDPAQCFQAFSCSERKAKEVGGMKKQLSSQILQANINIFFPQDAMITVCFKNTTSAHSCPLIVP